MLRVTVVIGLKKTQSQHAKLLEPMLAPEL